MRKILVVNPGSTSTKIALYAEAERLWQEDIDHSAEELRPFPTVFSQCEMRTARVLSVLALHGEQPASLAAIAARGGVLPPVKSGAYAVNPEMLDVLEHRPVNHHASNLGAAIAYKIATPVGIPAYVYDPVTVDEMIDVVRVTGLPEIVRHGRGHNLNMRAAAMQYCAVHDCAYAEKTLIVAHLGGGITVSLHRNGQVIDLISDDEGAFSPERAGELPIYELMELTFQRGYSCADIIKKMQRKGGLMAHLGTTDSRQVEALIDAGDAHAKLVYEAMALSVARCIGKLAVVVNGAVDAIILTGGIAHSTRFTKMIADRVRFLAPVEVIPGENEMRALAEGVLRVLDGQETARSYQEKEE